MGAVGGRANQKERTRRAIVAATVKLVTSGRLPTVAQAAEEALVSPATAYRYFPDQLSLLSAALQDAFGGVSERFQPDLGDEPRAVRRVDIATEGLLRRIMEREPLVRAVMALSLLRSVDPDTARGDAAAIRPGFRVAWIDEALRPAEGRVPAEDLRRLKLALGVVMSSEGLIALQDIMRADKEEAVAVCRWMARTLTESVLREAHVEEG